MTVTPEKVSYVLDGNSEIGFSLAGRLATTGCTVRFLSSNKRRLEQAEIQFPRTGNGKSETRFFDITDDRSLKKIIKEIALEIRHIEQFISDYGCNWTPGSFLECTESEYDRYAKDNRNIFFLIQAIARNMLIHGNGTILTIGSQTAHNPMKMMPSAAYSMAKASLHALTRNLAIELGEHRIRVNTLEPGFEKLTGTGKLVSSSPLAGKSNQISAEPNHNDLLDHIVEHGAFLVSTKADWTTGAVHVVGHALAIEEQISSASN